MKYFIRDRSFIFPLFLLLICILTYGILAPSLGFSWDDWPAIWMYEVHGAEGLVAEPLRGGFWFFHI